MKVLQQVFFCLLISCMCLRASAGGAENPSHAPLVDGTSELQALLEPLKSFTANFTQTVFAADGYLLQEAAGQIKVARPGRVHWVSHAPLQQVVVSNGETLWVYDPDLEQVAIQNVEEHLVNTPAVLLVGSVEGLSDSYQVSVETADEGRQFTLIPTDESSLYQKLTLYFSNGKPIKMALWDTLGQKTSTEFNQLELNPIIDPAIFIFTPPAGVDVLVND